MNDLSAPVVHSAAAKLRGQVVTTPVIGGVHLAGDGEVDLRWKAELIQTGGSGWYRGYLHLLLKSYGALPGVSFCGPVAQVLAAAVAAYHHRLSMHVFSSVPLLDDVNEALASLKATVEVVADPVASAARMQRQNGHLPLPGAEHPEVAAGLATIGMEFGTHLPAECTAVYVPSIAAAAIAAGLAVVGRTMPVVPVDTTMTDTGEALRCKLSVGRSHRVVLGETSASVLAAALRHRGGGVVGAVALD
jgi:threonine dehydratase